MRLHNNTIHGSRIHESFSSQQEWGLDLIHRFEGGDGDETENETET